MLGISNVGIAASAVGPVGVASASVVGEMNPGQPQQQKRQARRGAKPAPDRATRALYCFSLKNPIRRLCIHIVEWK